MSPNVLKLMIAPVVGATLCCVMLSGCGSGGSDSDIKTTVTEKDGEDVIQPDTPRIKEDTKKLNASPTAAATNSATPSSTPATTPAP